jgi:hypothetical protein
MPVPPLKLFPNSRYTHFETRRGNLANFADLVLEILRKEKKRAVAGLVVLFAGFVLQLFSRLDE